MDFFELGNDANMIAYDKQLKKGDLTKEQIEKREDARKKRLSVIANP